MDGFRSKSNQSCSLPPLLVSPHPVQTLTPPLPPSPAARHSILKMFSADKKRVETALESCGLNFNRVGGAAWWAPPSAPYLCIPAPGLPVAGFLSPHALAPRVNPSGLMSFPWKSLSAS